MNVSSMLVSGQLQKTTGPRSYFKRYWARPSHCTGRELKVLARRIRLAETDAETFDESFDFPNGKGGKHLFMEGGAFNYYVITK